MGPAQGKPIPVIGFVNGTSLQGYGRFVSSFRQALEEHGYVEGKNVVIEYRWAEGHYERLPSLVADLIQRQVSVIVATSTPANITAKRATTEIPIVFTTSSDPVELGLVPSLVHPGGNVTGAVTLNVEVVPKRLELIHEALPDVRNVGVLVNPTNPNSAVQSHALGPVAQSMGLKIEGMNAQTESEIDVVFSSLGALHVGAMIVSTDAFLYSRRRQIAALAKRYSMPTIYDRREFVENGGLMSYGGSVDDIYRLAGFYTARILDGAKPSDLPVVQSTKTDLAINLNAARDIHLNVPASLLARADEVIE
jgi:putative ABC transport system substrate-binding protein